MTPPTDDVLKLAQSVSKRTREVKDWLARRFIEMTYEDRDALALNIALLETLGADPKD